ncbi:MAG: C45 family autoproteolytic acyltransferase/hydrolase [Planctomycetaceae bacterium]|jgi:acyl transferase domain-containing protein|nr:C45 family autoproteolytic acyltransferase/hydrolase [Planctomycetaceae bacterium]
MDSYRFPPLAIIGFSCLLPDALTRDDFWNLILNGRSPIRELPRNRFDASLYYDPQKGVKGKSFTKIAAVIDHEHFQNEILPDFLHFLSQNVSNLKDIPNDVGHQISLYAAYQALTHAGYSLPSLSGMNIGAFLGIVSATNQFAYRTLAGRISCYLEKLQDMPDFKSLPDDLVRQIKNEYQEKIQSDYRHLLTCGCERISPHDAAMDMMRCFGLRGIGLGLDSACSSSLTSIALAAKYLRAGKLDAALVGGISYFSFSGMIHYSNVSAASNDGSRPFDQNANGFVPGEGCAYAVVKTLEKATADGDNIFSVIRGLGISSDGKGKGLWAPRREGQELAIRRAYSSPEEMRKLDYVEAHATSTILGDATELSALVGAFGENPPEQVYLTSHKANIGHIFEAAGMVGIIKVLLAMQHQTIPPQINFKEPTTAFDWKKSPFAIPTTATYWRPKENRPRTAAVDAFGIGGLNGHVVLEEAGNEIAKFQKTSVPRIPNTPIAIVGMGCVLPGAFSCSEFWNLLQSGKNALSPIPHDRNDLLFTKEELKERTDLKAGFVRGYEYDWKRHKIPPNQIAKANPLQFMILGAADEALENAGIASRYDKNRTAVVVGARSESDFYAVLNMILFMPELRDRMEKILREKNIDAATSTKLGEAFARRLYKEYPALDDETGGFTISTLASRIAKAYDLTGGATAIDGGLCGSTVALENAVHILQHDAEIDTVVCASGYRSMGYSRFQELKNSEIIPAEGTCAVILRRLEDAKRDGASIRAIIRGISGASDTNNVQNAVNRAIRETLQKSEINAAQISFRGYISSGSDSESRLVNLNNPVEKTENAELRQIGHTGPVAGMVSLIKNVLQMERLQTAPPEVGEDGRVFASVTDVDPCGMAYHVVLERGAPFMNLPQNRENAKNQTTKSSGALRLLEKQETQKIFNRKNVTSLSLSHLNFVKTNQNHRKVAFLFPGQGSQKEGMFRKLAAELPSFAEKIAQIDAILQRLQLSTFSDMVYANSQLLGKDVLRTQLSLLAADTLILSQLEEWKIAPDVVLGHSYGEYPALVAAGVWSFETAARATAKRCEAIVQFAPAETGMLSVNADETALRRLLNEIGGELYVSNRNAPDQTIVAGKNDDLKELKTRLKEHKFNAVVLPVPAAFHSPLVKNVCQPLESVLAESELQPPHRLFLSGVTTRFEADPDTIRENLVEQMIKPVDFVGMIRKAYQTGCRAFVEAGPKRVLTNLAKKILADKNDVQFFTCDDGKEGSLELLQQVRDAILLNERSNKSCEYRERNERKEKQSFAESPTDSTSPHCSPANGNPPVLPVGLTLFEVSGAPYQMGFSYGKQDAERIRYVLRRYADAALQAGNMLPDVKEEIKNLPLLLTPENLDEIHGIADGAEVPLDALLRHQFSVFPESDAASQQRIEHLADRFIKQNAAISAGCVHFAGRANDDVFVHGGNLDLPLARMLPGTLAPTMIVKRESGKSTYAALGIAGHCGCIGGLNEYGICVSSCILLDYPRTEKNTNGILHTSLVPKILAEAKTLDDAAEIVKTMPKTGGWAMIISEISSKRFLHIEYNGNEAKINTSLNCFLQANHSELLQPSNNGNVPSHSLNRKKRLAELLTINAEGKFSIDSGAAFRVLRDDFDITRKERPLYRTMNTVCRVDNVFSWLVDTQKQTLKIAVKNESNWKEIAIRDILSVKSDDNQPQRKENKIKQENEERRVPDKINAPFHASTSVVDYETFLKRNASVDARSSLKTRNTATERFVNRMVETVVPKTPETFSFSVAALIYGDAENEVANLLEQKILQSGTKVFRIAEALDAAQLKEKLDSLWNESPFYAVFLVNSYDKNATLFHEENIWNERFERGIIAPVLLCKYWYAKLSETKQLDKLELINASRLGGDFGISSQIGAVEGAAGNGIVKSVFTEAAGHYSLTLHTKTVDHGSEELPETVVENLLREYTVRDYDREIGYQNGRRYTCRMIPTAIGVARGDKISDIEIDETLDLTEWIDITQPLSGAPNPAKKPAWLIAGGARGVTAEIAYAIGKRFGAKLYLIGSSPIPQIDSSWRNLDADGLKQLKTRIVKEAVAKKEIPVQAWKRVEKALEMDQFFQRLKNEKMEYEYFSCDVTNESAIDEIISQILVKEKQLDGFIHGAGIDVATRIEKKKEDLIRKTIEIKVKGVANILNAMKNTPPKIAIGMGSTSGRIGSFGQFDYSVANETMSKYLNHYSAKFPESHVFTMCWTAWGEVGMGMRPETFLAMNAIGLVFLPPKEAISYLFSELQHGQKEREVVISAWNDYKKTFPDSLSFFDVPKKRQSVASETASPFVTGNNASARKIRLLLNEKNISDTIVVASGHDLEGLAIVPQSRRQRWFDETIVPTLSRLEFQLEKDKSDKPQKLIVLTSLAEIPAGKEIFQKLETIQKKNRFITLKSVDLPLDAPPDVVAQKVIGAINHNDQNQNTSLLQTQFLKTQSQPLLIDEILEQTESRVSFRCVVDPKNDTFLLEHQLQRRPILPVVIAVELMAETSLLFPNAKTLKTIRNLKILCGMKCTVDEPYRLTATAEKTDSENDEEIWKATIAGDYYNPKGVRINERRPYFSAQIIFGERKSEQMTIPQKGRQHFEIEYPEFGTRPLFHGAPLRGLRYVDFDNADSLTGKVDTISQRALFQSRWNREKHSIDKSVVLNPSLLDACLWASGVLHGIGNPNASILPDYFENIEIGTATASIGKPCVVCVRRKADVPLPMGYRNIIYDFALCKISGETIYRVNGFRATEVKVK